MMNLLRNRNEMDDFGSNFLEALFGNHPMNEVFLNNAMRTDIEVENNKCILNVDLAGYAKDEIKIDFENGYLHIEANKKEVEENKKDKKYIYRERFSSKQERTYYLGENYDGESIKAVFENGVLKIEVLEKQKEIANKREITIE